MPRSPFSVSPIPPDAGPTLADALWDATRHPDPIESHRLVDDLLTRSASARAALRARGVDVDRIIRTMGENRPSDAIDRATLTLVDAHASDAHRRVALDILTRAFLARPRHAQACAALRRRARDEQRSQRAILRDAVQAAVVLVTSDVETARRMRFHGTGYVKDSRGNVAPVRPTDLLMPDFARWLRAAIFAATARHLLDDGEPSRTDAISDSVAPLDAHLSALSAIDGIDRLSELQRDILSRRALGQTNAEIARALDLRRNTVAQHVRRAKSLLNR